MSDDKKSIIISKNFLTSSKSKKRKPKINNVMKGVSMKKKLLQQVKKHHNKTLKNQFSKNQFSKNKNDYITKNQEILPWKKFNRNMAISVEFDLKY